MNSKILSKFFLFFSLLLVSARAVAVQEYYSIHRSVRALGMGNAFYGLSDDEAALFYNPAGLANYSRGTEFMIHVQADAATKLFQAINTLKDVDGRSVGDIASRLEEFQGSPLYGNVGLAFPYFATKNFALSLLLANTKANFAVLGRGIDSSVDLTVMTDHGLVIGYGDSFFDPDLSLGINLKGLFRAAGNQRFSVLEIAQGRSVKIDPKSIGGGGAGVDFDLGASYNLPGFFGLGEKNRVSLILSNLLASKLDLVKIDNTTPPGLPRMLSLSFFSELPGIGPIDKFNAVLDFSEFFLGGNVSQDLGRRNGSLWKHANLGLEVPFWNWVILRGGIHQGYWTAGLGIDARFLRLDIATYAEELGLLPGQLPSRRVAMRVALGWGGATPQAVPSATETPAPEETPKPEEKPVEEPKAEEKKPEEAPAPNEEPKGQTEENNETDRKTQSEEGSDKQEGEGASSEDSPSSSEPAKEE